MAARFEKIFADFLVDWEDIVCGPRKSDGKGFKYNYESRFSDTESLKSVTTDVFHGLHPLVWELRLPYWITFVESSKSWGRSCEWKDIDALFIIDYYEYIIFFIDKVYIYINIYLYILIVSLIRLISGWNGFRSPSGILSMRSTSQIQPRLPKPHSLTRTRLPRLPYRDSLICNKAIN